MEIFKTLLLKGKNEEVIEQYNVYRNTKRHPTFQTSHQPNSCQRNEIYVDMQMLLGINYTNNTTPQLDYSVYGMSMEL